MKYSKRKEKKREKIKNAMIGEGVFLYENNTDADLYLPKPSIEGYKVIGPRKRFTGDSYFLTLVKTPVCLIRLIQEIKSTEEEIKKVEEKVNLEQKPNLEEKSEKKEKKVINSVRKKKAKKSKKTIRGKKMKEKLILDQPETVTKSGKLEQIENVEEQQEEAPQEEKLLTENPSGNIEIISE